VQELATTTARVRITATTSGKTDSSDANFTITNVPSITVTSPTNSGLTRYTGVSEAITWTTSGGLTGDVKIQLSTNGGSSYTDLETVAASAGTTSWNPSAGQIATNCKIRVVSVTYSQIMDASDNDFEVKAPFITVTSPASGVTWDADDSRSITWTSGGFTGNVVIEYSTDGGSSYTEIETVANSGSKSWTVPNLSSSNSKIKISSASSASIFGVSATFTIANGSPYVIYGSGTISTRSGANDTSICGDGYCASLGDSFAPTGNVLSITLNSSAFVVIGDGAPDTIGDVVINGGSTLVLNKAVTFTSLTINSGSVQGTAYSGTWNGTNWSSNPGPGNGRIEMTVTGALTIGASGSIVADGLGYPASTGNGYSYSGSPGAGGGGAFHFGGRSTLRLQKWDLKSPETLVAQ
jgi:hypothetical protein